MLTRKRKNLKDEYVQLLAAPFEKEQKINQFYENLRHFYKKKWGFSLRSPYANGKQLELYDLYEAVTSLGGWQKVTNFDRWSEVLQKLSISENVQMAEHAIRIIYMQYLYKFEQNENGGDVADEHENELLGSRSTRLKGFNALPFYTEQPPPISAPRTTSENFPVPDFHKLVLSLLSGLPNEVAFALNLLTIMSHPGPFVLNFSLCPSLINILVSIIGFKVVFEEDASPENLHEWWKETSGYDFKKFWSTSGVDEQIINSWVFYPKTENGSSEKQKSKISPIFSALFEDDNFDLNIPINWRVFNVLGIFHNLSFEEFCQQPMAENKALLRLLLICCKCRWQLLKRISSETLSNIAKTINLISIEEPLAGSTFFNAIKDGIKSNDRFEVLRFMEIVAGLCQTRINEPILCDFLERVQFFPRIFTLITLKDILICVVSLETLLQISELGKTACDMISSCGKAMEQLVGMLTTDAASFGQAGLSGIKVFEIRGSRTQPYTNPNKKNLAHPTTLHHQHPQQQQFQASTSCSVAQSHVVPAAAEIYSNGASSFSSSSSYIGMSEQQPQTSSTTTKIAAPFSPPPTVINHQKQPHHHYPQQQQQQQNSAKSQYMCEWMMMALDNDNEEIEPCSRFFASASQLLFHIYDEHLKALVHSHSAATKRPGDVCMIRCRWPVCDNTPRTLWSMTTHLQDVHCTEQSLNVNLRRRNEVGLDEYVNQIRYYFKQNRDQGQQPGYAPYAAYDAIRRHAFTNLKKDLPDESEGPVTRNIRLTAAIILRNLCKFSPSGRRKMQRYEGFMSWLSLSKMESSRTLAQCLFEQATQPTIDAVEQTQQRVTTAAVVDQQQQLIDGSVT